MLVFLNLILFFVVPPLLLYLLYKVLPLSNFINKKELKINLQLVYDPEIGFLYEVAYPHGVWYYLKVNEFKNDDLKVYLSKYIKENNLNYNLNISKDEENVFSQASFLRKYYKGNFYSKNYLIDEFKEDYPKFKDLKEIFCNTPSHLNNDIFYYPFIYDEDNKSTKNSKNNKSKGSGIDDFLEVVNYIRN